jgi:putative ABC transport system permease protein
MGFLLRTWAIFVIVVKRLLAQWELALITILGLTTSITLIVSIPLYADAVYHRTFLEKVSGSSAEQSSTAAAHVLPLSFMFNYSSSVGDAREWDELLPFDKYLYTSSQAALGLPITSITRYVTSEPGELFPIPQSNSASPGADASAIYTKDSRITWGNLGMMTGIEEHITLTEGSLPQVAEIAENSIIDVLISLPLANQLGLQVGEEYILRLPTKLNTGSKAVTFLPLRISGIWQPTDLNDTYWMFSPSNLVDVFLIPEGTFVNRISPVVPGEIYYALWYVVADGSKLTTDEVGALLTRITRMQSKATSLLPHVSVSRSPVDALVAFQKSSRQLTILLYAFVTPILGLILAFISLVSNLMVERKRNEMAVTRSRGATAGQVLGSVGLESLLLGVAALLVSFPAALWLSQFIGQTRSFMDFSVRMGLQANLSRSAVQAGLISVGVALLTALLPSFSAVRYTIVSYKQSAARLNRPPLWQRAWLDVLLLIPGVYGLYLVRQQGSVIAAGSSDPLANPLSFLVPSLLVLALTLLCLRLVPKLMAILAWLLARTHFVGLLLAARQLARSPGYYNTPLLILVFTLSLSAYTASLAQTLDQHISDQQFYAVGAELQFLEIGEPPQASPFPVSGENQVSTNPEFLFFPVSEYLKIPGIQAVARLGNYAATASPTPNLNIDGRFFGVDRLDFPRAAYWRRNFALADLGTLMNALGVMPNGVLVPRDFLARASLREGDSFDISVKTDVKAVTFNARIVGSFDYFPTWYEPKDGVLFVGNLENLFELAGGQSPYQVLAKTTPDLDFSQVGNFDLRELNMRVLNWDAAPPEIDRIQQRPEQQGIFGFLFIGFAAAAVLTVVGFMLYAMFSYQRRFIELGVLRAAGLSRGQMATYLGFELVFLILFGGGVGTGLGWWISNQIIPYLQIGSQPIDRIPPFQVIIAWNSIFQIYALFGLLFIFTLAILVYRLQRMKIFQAIKLGEIV